MFPLNYKNLLNKLDLFFPRKCMSCGFDLKTPGLSYICNQCFDKIIPIEETKGTKCQYCSAFLYESQTNLCYECHTYGRAFTKNTSLFYYQDIIIKELVHLFKFNSVLAAGRELSELINSELNILLKKTNYDILTITPLSSDSIIKRGFNQVAIILDHCHIPYQQLLLRKKHDKHQSELSALERKIVIKDQFQLDKQKSSVIAGKKILIIDDIFTTGSTLNEISQVLLNNGAMSVEAITFFKD